MDIALSLPFQVDTNTGFGILSKVYLDALTHLNGGECVTDRNAEGVADIKSTALDIVEETFASSVKNPRLEVERGFRFWDVVRQMVILGYCLAANYVNMYRRSLVSGLWQPRQAVFFPTSHRRSTTPTPGSRLCARERPPHAHNRWIQCPATCLLTTSAQFDLSSWLFAPFIVRGVFWMSRRVSLEQAAPWVARSNVFSYLPVCVVYAIVFLFEASMHPARRAYGFSFFAKGSSGAVGLLGWRWPERDMGRRAAPSVQPWLAE